MNANTATTGTPSATPFVMSIPSKAVIEEEVKALVKPDDAETTQVKEQAAKNVQAIMQMDLETLDARKGVATTIENFGLSSMTYSNEKNDLLSISVEELSKKGADGGSVAKGLMSLQEQMSNLNPSGIDFTRRGILGKFFNPLRSYFARYQSAQKVIGKTMEGLEDGRKMLERDNTTLMAEQQRLREITKTMYSEVDLGIAMKENLENQVEEAKQRGEDQYKVDFIVQEVVFPLSQRVMDLQQLIVVNQQGILASELVIRTNRELIRGVTRAKLVTLTALRNAVMVASALSNQKLVLDAIDGLNTTTASLIEGTSEILKTQGVAIQQQAMSSMIPVETLKKSFSDYFEAMDSITTFKEKAIPEMSKTIFEFQAMLTEGAARINKLERGTAMGI